MPAKGRPRKSFRSSSWFLPALDLFGATCASRFVRPLVLKIFVLHYAWKLISIFHDCYKYVFITRLRCNEWSLRQIWKGNWSLSVLPNHVYFGGWIHSLLSVDSAALADVSPEASQVATGSGIRRRWKDWRNFAHCSWSGQGNANQERLLRIIAKGKEKEIIPHWPQLIIV